MMSSCREILNGNLLQPHSEVPLSHAYRHKSQVLLKNVSAPIAFCATKLSVSSHS